MSENAKTLPDYLKSGLTCVSVGLNPSIPSVMAGYYFANPRNRFWRALNASGLLVSNLEPGLAAVQLLYRDYGFGFTDLVKRPTSGVADLKAADFKYWAPHLQQKLHRYKPKVIWFHGKVAYQHYLRYAENIQENVQWGVQQQWIAGAHVFVTPNPSSANAAFSLEDLVSWYGRLNVFLKHGLN